MDPSLRQRDWPVPQAERKGGGRGKSALEAEGLSPFPSNLVSAEPAEKPTP
jgi:hypothetical protein